MDRKIKLIWDFRGPDAARIAEHFRIHLGECTAGGRPYPIGTQEYGDGHCIAYMIVPEGEMRPVRDRLKPHRGEYVEL